MTQTADIGAARVSLIVDASEFEPVIRQGKNVMEGFGAAAEAAYARQSKAAQRASNSLLDYVAQLRRMGTSADAFKGLDTAAANMDKLVRKASRVGTDKLVLDAAAKAWQEYALEVQHAAAIEENAQRGVDATALLKKRAMLEGQVELYNRIERAALEAANAERAQATINARTGVTGGAGLQARSQSALIAELERQVQLEQRIEAEARDIHAEWSAIERQINAVGKSTYDIMRANAVQRYGADAAKPLLDQINRFEQLNKTIGGTTINTKQLQQAVRFLPAQFTDIGVSLASGMNPLLVTLQQGGQILDQFRLSGATTADTLRTVGAYALKLVNPITVSTAAVVALAYAGYDAAKSMENLAIATAKGFNAAGSPEQLYTLIEQLNKLENIRLGPAEEAVGRLAAGGLVVGTNFTLAAESAARWASITGEKADEVVRAYETIARDPLKAIQDGLVRVTEEQYEYVRSLTDAGREQDAVNEVTRIFYETINNNSAQVESHLSGVSRYFSLIKDNVGEATRKLGEFSNGLANFAVDYENTYQRMVAQGANPFIAQIKALYSADPSQRLNATAPSPLVAPTVTPQQAAALTALDRQLASSGTKAQQYSRAVEQLNGSFGKLTATMLAQRNITRNADGTYSGEGYERLLTSLKDRFKERKGGGAAPRASSAAKEVRAQYDAELAALQTQSRQVEANYRAQSISATAYYDSLSSLAKRERDIQVESNNAQIAAVAGRKGAEQELARLRAANLIADERLAQRLIDIDSQRQTQLKQIADAHKQYAWQLQDSVKAQQESITATINRLRMGDREFEQWNATNELYRERDRLLEDLKRKVETGAMTVEDAEIDKQAAIDATNQKIAQQGAAYAQIAAAQADWSVGASKAWKDWQAEVEDVAGQAERVMSYSLEGISGSIADALTGNLDSFRSFFDNLHLMILQFIVKQQLTKWLQSLNASSSNSGNSGGGWINAIGSFVGALFGKGATANAKGGVYGDSGLSALRNSIVSSPRYFAFGKGGVPNVGVVGETLRSEAILPLKKMSGGNFGVEATVAGGNKTVKVEQHFHIQGMLDRSSKDQLRRDVAGATQQAMSKV